MRHELPAHAATGPDLCVATQSFGNRDACEWAEWLADQSRQSSLSDRAPIDMQRSPVVCLKRRRDD